MATKAVAILFVLCLFLAAAVPTVKANRIKDCYNRCYRKCYRTRRRHALCADLCLGECMGSEFLGLTSKGEHNAILGKSHHHKAPIPSTDIRNAKAGEVVGTSKRVGRNPGG